MLYKDFQPWEKPEQHTWKNIVFISPVFDIVNQLLTHHSPFAPLVQVDERTAKPSPSSIQGGLSEFFQIMASKTLQKSAPLTDSDIQTFPEREDNKRRKDKPKVMYSVALVMAFLAAENENPQLDDLPQVDFGRVPERFLLLVRTKSITENFLYI